MKSLIQPIATFALAGATFVLGQNNPAPYSQEVRTRALVIVDGDGKEAGRFASLDDITTLTMTPVGNQIVMLKARENQLDAKLGVPGGGLALYSSVGATSFDLKTPANGSEEPTQLLINQRPGNLDIIGREPKSGGNFNLFLDSQPERSWLTYGNKHGGWGSQIDSDGVFVRSGPKRKSVEGGG